MTHLFSLARSLPAQGLQVKQLKAQHERPAREAKLQVSFQAITIWPPKNGAALSKTPIQAWVVRVWEEEPPDGCEPLEWILVTTLPVETEADAWQCVEWYGYRWLCEDYHQGLKTGCALEARQVRSYEALTRLLGLLAPMAVRLLQLRAAAQHAPDAPATSVIPDEIVQVVTALTPLPEKPHPKNKSAKRPADQPMTLDELWRAIAGLGGYLGRKGDGPPGWKTLWRGWFYVQQVLDGVHLAARLPSFKNG